MYNNWEKNVLYGCKCDWGFAGADCSQVMCYKGDDPLTTGQTNYIIIITTGASTANQLTGSFKFAAGGFSVTFNADASTISTDCSSIFSALPNIGTVTCARGTPDSNSGATLTVTITSWSIDIMQNNLHEYGGNPSLSVFNCDASSVTSANPTCTITSGNNAGDDIREYDFCSNRGWCDFSSGTCECWDGYEGLACQTITVTPVGAVDNPTLIVSNTHATFSKDLVLINIEKGSVTDFNIIKMSTADQVAFQVRGDGNVTIGNGLSIQSGGSTIASGGLFIRQNCVTITGKNYLKLFLLVLMNYLKLLFLNHLKLLQL